MANWYNRVVVPRLLNCEMGSADLERIRREVIAEASGAVLEIGVGPGYNLPLYKNIEKLYALEPSLELTAIAKGRAQGLPFPVEFVAAGAEHIPLSDQSIDTVVSTWTLCSVSNPKQVLSEIRRVLRPGGRFIFADHGASPKPWLRAVQTVSTSVSKYFTGNCHYDRPIDKLVKEAGLTIEGLAHPRERGAPLIYNYQGIATK